VGLAREIATRLRWPACVPGFGPRGLSPWPA
jgi:hypothetical protein